MKRVASLLRVPESTDEQGVQRHTLHVLLLGAIVACIIVLMYLLGTHLSPLRPLEADERILLWSVPAILACCALLLFVNRLVSGTAASIVFVVLLFIGALITDTPEQVAGGRGLLAFAVPILVASLLIRPWAGFLVSGLGGATIAIMNARMTGGLLNIPCILLLQLLAAISWLSARGQASLSRRLRSSNAALVQRSEELALLYEASRTLSQTLDLDVIYQRLYDVIRSIMPCDALVVSSFDPRDCRIHCAAAWQNGHRLDVGAFPPIVLEPEGQGSQSVVIRSGESLLVGDEATRLHQGSASYWLDPQNAPQPQTPAATKPMCSSLLVPLKVEDQVRGVIQVLCNQPGAYTEENLRSLEALAPHVAVAGNNASLYRQARKELAEREVMQQALRESEERYRGLFEGVPIGIYRTSPDGTILAANDALARMLGYPDSAALCIKAQQAFANSTDRDQELAILERDDSVHGVEVRLQRQDGTVIWARDYVHAVRNERGALLYYEGSLEDITEHKQLEEQLQHARQLETVGQLAGGVAHEYNNLLQVINGYSDLALEALHAEEPLHADLQEIRRAGTRAAELTAQLLAFARRQTLRIESLELNGILNGLRRTLRPIIGEDIVLEIKLGPNLDSVMADSGQIAQVILNLAANARDAIHERSARGGTITLGTANCTLAEPLPVHAGILPVGRYVCLAVQDSGSGMTEEVKRRLFEPFFTTKGVGRGTGLGLAAVYGIVQQLGGGIQVESEPGRGSTFTIYLPCRGAHSGTHPPAPSAPLPHGMESVLVVEDDPAVRTLAARLLRSLGYDVLEASSGQKGLTLCRQRATPVDLLLTDVVMPDMGGPELAMELGQLWPAMRVLFMSGYSAETAGQLPGLAQESRMLPKPFDGQQLATLVRQALDEPVPAHPIRPPVQS